MTEPNVITFIERKKWFYYKVIKKLKDFPTVPDKVAKAIDNSKVPYGENIELKGNVEVISLLAFRSRVKRYEVDHLPTRNVDKFNPSFLLKKS